MTSTHENARHASGAKRITGWVLSGLVGLFLIGASGLPKFSFVDWPGKAEMMQEMMDHLGIPMTLLPQIGVIEVSVAILFLIPRTSFVGAILTTGLLGGAVFTHVRVGDGSFEVLFPVALGALMWTGLALRTPALVDLVLGRSLAGAAR